MTDKFVPGEIAIGQNFINHPHLNDIELEIMKGFDTYCVRRMYDPTSSPELKDGYIVREDGGILIFVTPDKLRKRQPPVELSTWEKIQEDTGWNPTKQGITP